MVASLGKFVTNEEQGVSVETTFTAFETPCLCVAGQSNSCMERRVIIVKCIYIAKLCF